MSDPLPGARGQGGRAVAPPPMPLRIPSSLPAASAVATVAVTATASPVQTPAELLSFDDRWTSADFKRSRSIPSS
ncbi:hypothetical protein AXF42_Ash007764 [Apostasia shenzhenica]|uniref:Uncharacterized protein n=1 Tax=Apostasia shenzhenica TaxID=1088818 RepID=A0A2I0B597_9ASPA|nr:hypothetical protein AXF42_Ash007764 [Apostasia shenzhenica]